MVTAVGSSTAVVVPRSEWTRCTWGDGDDDDDGMMDIDLVVDRAYLRA